jgi:hypothetical protein
MALSYKRTRLDRRFGFALIAVFALGILGGTLATAMNGGQVPDTQPATVHLIKMTAPL